MPPHRSKALNTSCLRWCLPSPGRAPGGFHSHLSSGGTVISGSFYNTLNPSPSPPSPSPRSHALGRTSTHLQHSDSHLHIHASSPPAVQSVAPAWLHQQASLLSRGRATPSPSRSEPLVSSFFLGYSPSEYYVVYLAQNSYSFVIV